MPRWVSQSGFLGLVFGNYRNYSPEVSQFAVWKFILKKSHHKRKSWIVFQFRIHLVGGWTNPSEKYARQIKLDHFPIFRDEQSKTCLSCQPPRICTPLLLALMSLSPNAGMIKWEQDRPRNFQGKKLLLHPTLMWNEENSKKVTTHPWSTPQAIPLPNYERIPFAARW